MQSEGSGQKEVLLRRSDRLKPRSRSGVFSESSHNIFVETAPLDFSDGACNRTSLQDIVPHLPVKNHLRLVLQDKIDVSVYNS